MNNTKTMIAYVNNIFIEEEKATLQIGDLAIQRGYAAFDYFRLKNNCPLFLDDYLNRFFRSADLMYLQPTQTKAEVREIILELIGTNNNAESGMRMILTGGFSPDSYQPAVPNLIILQQHLKLPSEELFSRGIKVITHEYQRDLAHIKSINYFMGIWLQQRIIEQNAADVLYYKEGIVSELPRANVMMVTKDEKIVTPSNNILPGITRMKLMKLAGKKFRVEERDISIRELNNAAEVFLTSTTKRILPINQIDDHIIGDGKAGTVSTLLNNSFIAMENEIASFY
jgi:branched-chain amino acid aminotransferase